LYIIESSEFKGCNPSSKKSLTILKAGSAKRDAIPLSFQRKTLSLGRGQGEGKKINNNFRGI